MKLISRHFSVRVLTLGQPLWFVQHIQEGRRLVYFNTESDYGTDIQLERGDKKCIQILVGKRLGNMPLWRPKRREDNRTMVFCLLTLQLLVLLLIFVLFSSLYPLFAAKLLMCYIYYNSSAMEGRFHPLVAHPKGSTALVPAEHFPRRFWNNTLHIYCPLHPSYMLNPLKTVSFQSPSITGSCL
jgi:hypothetical protein